MQNLVWLIIVVGSVVGSFVAGPQLTSMAVTHLDHQNRQLDSDDSQIAEAAAIPLVIDWHYKIKEKVGDAANLKIDPNYIDAEIHCEPCTKVEYEGGQLGQAGFTYAFDKLQDLTGSKSVTFFIMGQDGGEKVKFKVAGKDVGNSPSTSELADTEQRAKEKTASAALPGNAIAPGIFKKQLFALTTEEPVLEKDWRKLSIDVSKIDLKGVTHPFGVELTSKKGTQTQIIFVKHITYDNMPAVNPLEGSAVDQMALLSAQGLSVGIIANSTNGTAPSAVEFTRNVSGGIAPYSLHWDFGNGNEIDMEQQENETGPDDVLTEVFDEPGTYNVTLDASDSVNQTGSSSIVISVDEPGENETSIGLEIQANATESAAPATIEFNAVVDSDDAGSFEYLWDFGDEETDEGNEQTVAHTFEDPGSYDVTVSATGAEGQTGSSSITIDVSEAEMEDGALDDSETNANTTGETEGTVDEEVESNSTSEADQDNSPPTVGAIDGILAYPGDTVILDASQSADEDGDEITFQWVQSSGPTVEVSDEDTATPRIVIPEDIEEDDEIVMEVTVSDSTASTEPHPVSITVDFVEAFVEAEDDDTIREQSLAPESQEVDTEWESECDDIIECLNDEQDYTFVSASGDGSTIDADPPELLVSFEDFSNEEEDIEVEYVELRGDASKSDDTGYLSFLIGEDGEQEPTFTSDLVSIVTDPGEFGEYRLLLEEDPRSNSEWTLESINSLLAGISYGGGQSEVEVSELSLVVAYSAVPIEDEVESEPVEEESMTEEEPESELNDQEGDDTAAQEGPDDHEDSNDADIPADEADQQDLSENPAATNSTEDQP